MLTHELFYGENLSAVQSLSRNLHYNARVLATRQFDIFRLLAIEPLHLLYFICELVLLKLHGV